MKAKIRYLWNDAWGEEYITKQPPERQPTTMGGKYIPKYKRVILLEVDEEDEY